MQMLQEFKNNIAIKNISIKNAEFQEFSGCQKQTFAAGFNSVDWNTPVNAQIDNDNR